MGTGPCKAESSGESRRSWMFGEKEVPQRGSHLFGDGVVEVLEDFEFDRITYAHDECTSSRGDCGLY
jgi:hypothetical protein